MENTTLSSSVLHPGFSTVFFFRDIWTKHAFNWPWNWREHRWYERILYHHFQKRTSDFAVGFSLTPDIVASILLTGPNFLSKRGSKCCRFRIKFSILSYEKSKTCTVKCQDLNLVRKKLKAWDGVTGEVF